MRFVGGDFEVVEKELIGVAIEGHVDGAHFEAACGLAHVHDEYGKSLGLVLQLVVGRRAGQQEHQVRLGNPRDEYLLAVHQVRIALADGGRFDARGLGAGVGLGDGKGLEPQLAAGDAGEVALLLLIAAVTQDDTHDVHLGVASRGVAAGPVDLFENHAGLGDGHAAAAVLLGNEGGEPAELGELPDKRLGVGALLVEGAPVGAVVLLADVADGEADVVEGFAGAFDDHDGIGQVSGGACQAAKPRCLPHRAGRRARRRSRGRSAAPPPYADRASGAA